MFLLLCSLFLGKQPQGGKETTLHGHEEIPELRQKLVKRILNWSTEELMTAAYTSVRAYPRALLLATHTLTRTLTPPLLAPLFFQFDDVKAILNHKFDEDETPEDLRHLLELVLESEELTPLELNPATGAYQSVLADPYPYFGFIPPYLQSLIPDAPAMTWSTDCWGTNSATAATQSDGSVLISITVAHQKEFLCSDSYLMASVCGCVYVCVLVCIPCFASLGSRWRAIVSVLLFSSRLVACTLVSRSPPAAPTR